MVTAMKMMMMMMVLVICYDGDGDDSIASIIVAVMKMMTTVLHARLSCPGMGIPTPDLPWRRGDGRVRSGRLPLPPRGHSYPPRFRPDVRERVDVRLPQDHEDRGRHPGLLLRLLAHPLQADPLHDGQVRRAGAYDTVGVVHSTQQYRRTSRSTLLFLEVFFFYTEYIFSPFCCSGIFCIPMMISIP